MKYGGSSGALRGHAKVDATNVTLNDGEVATKASVSYDNYLLFICSYVIVLHSCFRQ
jgi:hypothetical protein